MRLTVSHPTRSFVMFLMLAGHLRPGYDYLIRRKLPVLLAASATGTVGRGPGRVPGRRAELGFTERTRTAAASQVIGRLLIQTGRRLDALTDNDFDDLLAASAARHGRRETQSSLQQRHPHRSAGDVSSRCAQRTAGQRDQPAAPKFCPADARRYLRRCGARSWPTSTGSPPPTAAARSPAPRPGSTTSPRTWPRSTRRSQPGRVGPAPPHRDLPDRDRRGDQLPHRRTDPGLLSAAAGSWRCTACSTTSPNGAGRSTRTPPSVSLRHPQAAPALPRYLTADLDRRLTHALQAWPERLPAQRCVLPEAAESPGAGRWWRWRPVRCGGGRFRW